jgi:23S rRNA (adenine2030-N6)-methyltransferase
LNYRHIFHAGNFADVVKHAVLTLCLDALTSKDKPLLLADLHAGIGRYDLTCEDAEKTGEFKDGVDLLKGQTLPGSLERYWSIVKEYGYPAYYPGSPLFLDAFRRKDDRLILNELHQDDSETLYRTMAGLKPTAIRTEDAYACLKSLLPPLERRALILIDPPFEDKDEFAKLTAALEDAQRRFAQAVFVIWYPIKPHLPLEKFYDAIANQGWHRAFCVEAMRYPAKTPDVLNGSGLMILNAPYPVPENAQHWTAPLKSLLNLYSIEFRWLSASV